MNFVAGTIGELVIVMAFVFWIWLDVLIDTVRNPLPSTAEFNYRKLLLTSLGLVFISFAIVGVMGYRINELLTGNWPFVLGVVVFYIIMALGGFLLIVAASIGTSGRLIKLFLGVSAAWTAYVFMLM